MDNLLKTKRSKAFSGILLTFLIFSIGLFMVDFGSAVTSDNLISYHSFDQSSGSNVITNTTLTGTNLTVVNTDFSWISGKIGNAGRIDGVTGGVVSLNFTDLTDYQIGSGNFSMNFWFLADATSAPNKNVRLFSVAGVSLVPLPLGSSGLYVQSIGTANNFRWGTTITSGNYEDNQGWQMATTVKNGTSCSLYLNGSLTHVNDCTATNWNTISQILFGNFNGVADDNGAKSYDEAGFWMRALSQTDIDDLYNSGSGIGFGGIIDTLSIDLISPSNQTVISDNGTTFVISGDVTTNHNVTNMTYFVWDGSGLHNQTMVTNASANQTFYESLFIDNFTIGSYTWGAQVCYENITFGGCTSSENFTFSVASFSILENDYNANTVEGSLESFGVNVSVLTGFRIEEFKLNYNGVDYDAPFVEYSTNNYRADVNVNVPLVSTETKIPFYWNISFEDATIGNTTTLNQTVSDITLDDCSVGTHVLFNFTMVDEDSQAVLNGASENTSMKYELNLSRTDNTDLPFNFSKHYDEVNPALVCSDVDLASAQFRVDSTMEYVSSGRFVEFHNLQNYLLTNTTDFQNITLYNLNSSKGQEFKITYKGTDFIPVENVIVQIQRKYLDEGLFKVIEIPKSGSNGITIAHLIPNDIIYSLIFLKEGVVLDTFTNVIATCQNPAITECEINLNAFISGDSLLDIVTEDDFFSSLVFDRDTMTVSATYGIISGIPGVVDLTVTKLDNLGITSVCSDTLTSAGGTLQCVVPDSFGNSTIRAVLELDGDIRREGVISLNPSPRDQFGGALIFISIIMLLFLFGIGTTDNPLISGVLLILGLVILVALNLVYSESLLGPGATILWFVIAVVVIMIKGGSKR